MRDLGILGVAAPLLALALAHPFVGVMLWSWVSFMNPHRLAWGFAQTIPWAALAFGATVVGCLVAREPRRPAVNAATVLLALLLVCVTATSFAALNAPEAVWSKWDRTFKVLLGLLLTASLLTSRRRVHAMLWLMVLSLGYFGVRGGLFTLLTGGRFIVLGPPDTMITDRNHLAVGLLVSIPLMNYLRLQSRHRAVRLGLVAAMALTLFSVVGSQSRGALLGLAAAAVLLWLRSPGKVVSGAAIALAVAAAIGFMPQSWTDRMQTMQSYEEDGSAMGRIRIWGAALNLALERPLVGGGFRAVYSQDIVDRVAPGTVARADHSIWFEALGEHGFPTFLVWLGVIGAGALYALRLPRLARGRPDLRWAHDLGRMAQVSIVAYVVGGTFLSLAYWDFFWTLIVVLGAAHAIAVREAAAGRRQPVSVTVAGPLAWRAQAKHP